MLHSKQKRLPVIALLLLTLLLAAITGAQAESRLTAAFPTGKNTTSVVLPDASVSEEPTPEPTVEPSPIPEIAVAWSGNSFIYSGAAQTPTASYEGQLVNVTVENGPAVNKGNYVAVASLEGYTITNARYDFSIEAAPVTVTAENKTKVYGDTAQDVLTYTVAPAQFANQVNASLSRESGEDAGEYPITFASCTTSNENLSLTTKDGIFTITAKPVPVTWEGTDRQFVFNGKEQGPVPTTEVADLSVTVSYDGFNAGQHIATASTTNGNYTLTNATTSFNIARLQVEFVPNDADKVYGDEDPEKLTYAVNLPQGATDYDYMQSLDVQVTRVPGEDVGTYDISLTCTNNDATNLEVLPGPKKGVFTIAQREVTLTPVAGQSKFFDSNDPVLAYTLSESEYQAQITGALTREGADDEIGADGTIGEGQKVGERYKITLGTIASTNLRIIFAEEDVYFAIKPRVVTVKPLADQKKVFDTADPAVFAYDVEKGDGLSSVDTYKKWLGALTRENAADEITAEGDIGTGQNVGKYAYVWPSSVPAERSNLDVRLDDENGNVKFEITKREVTVTPQAGQSKVFDTADPAVFAYDVEKGNGLSSIDIYKKWLGALTRDGAKDIITEDGIIGTGQGVGKYAYIWPTEVPEERQNNLDVRLNDADGSIKFEITKREVTVTPHADQNKVFDTADPAVFTYDVEKGNGLSGDAAYKLWLGTLTRQGAKDVIREDGVIGAGQAAGKFAYIWPEEVPQAAQNNLTVELKEETFEILPRAIQAIPDAGQAKQFGAVDVPLFTYKLNVNINTPAEKDRALHTDDFYAAHWIGGEMTREKGEKVGLHSFIVTTLEDVTRGSLILPAAVKDAGTDQEIKFEIKNEFVGTVVVKTTDMTTRTQKIEVSVSGITAELAQDEQPTLIIVDKNGAKVANASSITFAADFESDYFEISVRELKADLELQELTYNAWLNEGTYGVQLIAPHVEGAGAQVAVENVKEEFPIEKDQLSFILGTTNPVNDNRNLLGVSYKLAENGQSYCEKDQLLVTPSTYLYDNQAPYQDEKHLEIAQYEIEINGVSVGTEAVNLNELNESINTMLSDNLVGVTNAMVSVEVKISSPDLNETKWERVFRYDVVAEPWDEQSVLDSLDNRSKSFKVKFGEPSKIVNVIVTEFTSAVKGDLILDDDSELDGTDEENYGSSQYVNLEYALDALPLSSQIAVTITVEDYAGNRYTNATPLTGIKKANCSGIFQLSLQPGEREGEGEKFTVGGTPAIRVSGYAVGYEKLNINLTDHNGKLLLSDVITVPGETEQWEPAANAYWNDWLGNRYAKEELQLPEGEPMTLRVSYSDVNGGSFRTIVIYDTVCQDVVLLTPIFPGMRMLAGYAEPGSTVTVSWDAGDDKKEYRETETDYRGYFVFHFNEGPNQDEGITQPQITITATDLIKNSNQKDYDIPGRLGDVDMRTHAYPLGAMVQAENGMVQFVATPVEVKELANGPIELPLLTANYFKVGTITIAMDEEGKVTFTPVLEESYQRENASVYFNVYGQTPQADALSAENRGTGLNIEEGYVPADGEEVFWFVCEIQAVFTEDQLMMSDEVECIDIGNDPTFIKFQGMETD